MWDGTEDTRVAEAVFLAAVREGDGKKMQEFLTTRKISIDCTDGRGRTAVLISCQRNRKRASEGGYLSLSYSMLARSEGGTFTEGSLEAHQCLALLFELGAKESKGKYTIDPSTGMTALHFAAVNGSLECARLLLGDDQTVDQWPLDRFGLSPLHFAAWTGDSQMVAFLLEKGSKSDLKNQHCKDFVTGVRGVTPLHMAASGGNHGLLCCISPVFDQFYFRVGPISDRHIECAQLLLAASATPNTLDSRLYNPLHYAVMYQHVGIVKVLLESDFQSEAEKVDGIYQRHLYGTSPLDSARAHNQEIFHLMVPYRRDDRERIQEITEEAPIEAFHCDCKTKICEKCGQAVRECALDSSTADHRDVCPNEPMPCPNRVIGCQESFLLVADMTRHLKECPLWEAVCPMCALEIQRMQYEEHLLRSHLLPCVYDNEMLVDINATESRTPTPNMHTLPCRLRATGCGQLFPSAFSWDSTESNSENWRDSDGYHFYVEGCEEDVVECPACKVSFKRTDLAGHACFCYEFDYLDYTTFTPEHVFGR